MSRIEQIRKEAQEIKSKRLAEDKRKKIIDKAKQINGWQELKPEKQEPQIVYNEPALDIFNDFFNKPRMTEAQRNAIVEPKTPIFHSPSQIIEKEIPIFEKEANNYFSLEELSMFGTKKGKIAAWGHADNEAKPSVDKVSNKKSVIEFKFSPQEINQRIKNDPDIPVVDMSKKLGETNLQQDQRINREDELRSKFIKAKKAELEILEDKINSIINPVEIEITNEDEEFYINAAELADNLTMSELEKDPDFSLINNGLLYNKTYDKYIQLINNFKLEKNV